MDEIQGRRHPEERLLLFVDGQGACRPAASILLKGQGGHAAPRLRCQQEDRIHRARHTTSGTLDGYQRGVSQPVEPRRAAASISGILQRQPFPLCCHSAQSDDRIQMGEAQVNPQLYGWLRSINAPAQNGARQVPGPIRGHYQHRICQVYAAMGA